MAEYEYDNFVFYGSWIKGITKLKPELQDKVLAEIVRYGVGEELLYPDDEVVSAVLGFTMDAIDKAKEQYKHKQVMGSSPKGNRAAEKEAAIQQALNDGCRTAQDVADYTGYSKSTVDHSDAWRNRDK